MHALVRTVLRCRRPLSNITVNLISQTRGPSHVDTTEHEVWARCFHHSSLINNHHRSFSTMSSSEGENFDLKTSLAQSQKTTHLLRRRLYVFQVHLLVKFLLIKVATDQSADKEDNDEGACL
jgi:hypothetical protein